MAAQRPGEGDVHHQRLQPHHNAATRSIARACRPARGIILLIGCVASLAAFSPPAAAQDSVRIAAFNVFMNRPQAGDLIKDLSTPDHPQIRAVAEILQRVRPQIVLLSEFDYDAEGQAIGFFRKHYLARGQHVSGHPDGPADPIRYPYHYVAAVNTGVDSGLDLDRDGQPGGAADAFGFGAFPGQYGMVLLSQFPIDTERVRTFQTFLWKDMPGAALPDDPQTPATRDWYAREVLDRFRLSSKSHWDVPVKIGEQVLHVLASHPTPPVFDGPEDRNGRRNHDEIRLWADYVSPGKADYLYDDRGVRGGLETGAAFVILGDLNADPADGDTHARAIHQLLGHPRIHSTPAPQSAGAAEQSLLQGKTNSDHHTDPALDTGDFPEPPGNLRLDYVLPSREFDVRASGVFWPIESDPLFKLVGTYPVVSSDHRLVWLDVRWSEK